MIYLRSIELKKGPDLRSGEYPFSLPLVKKFGTLKFPANVVFFIGENGSGKSTILEAIAAGIKAVTVGSGSVETDRTLAHARDLGRQFRFTWNRRTHRGFFLRAEDFFNYSRKMNDTVKEMLELEKEYENRFSGYALKLAKGAASGQRSRVVERYGEDLDANSHGESFLKLFKQRLVPGGLYLLDEPEVPLSPQRQLTLLSMMRETSEKHDCQFIVATHSPILMALPGAVLYSFDSYPLKKIAYRDIEHVNITRNFLNNPEGFLKHL